MTTNNLLNLIEATPFTADHCVKCNICTSACPFAAVEPRFPGPKTVGPQAQRLREPGAPSPDHSVEWCSSCGICTLVCPHGVKVMEINTQAKAKIVVPQPQRALGPLGHAVRTAAQLRAAFAPAAPHRAENDGRLGTRAAARLGGLFVPWLVEEGAKAPSAACTRQ